jgi:malate/lactate dehydrogenase
MSKIGIVGLGKIGGQLADALLRQAGVKEVWLDTRDKEKLTGFLLSLQVTAKIIRSTVRVLNFDFNRLNELDLIIVCAKEHYDPRQLIRSGNSQTEWIPNNLRYIGFLNDYPLLKTICSNIKEYRGVVAVITNPVEVNTFLVAGWLPNARVVGLGASIDSSRFLFILNKSFNHSIANRQLNEIPGTEYIAHEANDACVLAGEHGFSLIPISGLWRRNKYLGGLPSQDIKIHLDEAIAIGFNIVKSIGYTLYDCIPAFLDDIRWLLQAGNQKCFRSFAVPIVNTCVTRPIKLDSNHQIIEFTDYTTNELEQLEDIKTRLGNLIREIGAAPGD